MLQPVLNATDSVSDLQKNARDARKKVLDLIYRAHTSHIGSNLSCVDIMTVLYKKVMNIDARMTKTRDRFILSKGWAAAINYVLLNELGILTDEMLATYGKEGGLIGLIESSTPGIEASTGACGHGLPIALGMALAARRSSATWKTYCLLSDGEMDCGTTWESASLAGHHKLGNLAVIVDYNKWQAMGRKNDILTCEPLRDRWHAFGWETIEIDGHDIQQIITALLTSHRNLFKPTCIVAHTVKGKGISFMEDKLEWHYKNVDDESYKQACAELS